MRTYYLEEMTWPEIQQALEDGYRTVVIYSGAIEQHGTHLPEGTDAIRAHMEAGDLAKRLGKALAAPSIRPGLSEAHMQFPGTITLRSETYSMIIEDYIASYIRHGFHTFILASTHGGNLPTMEQAAEKCLQKYPTVSIITGCKMSDIMKLLAEAEKKEVLNKGTCGGHSCDFETSMMLALSNLVQMDKAEPGLIKELTPELADQMNQEGLSAVTANGILGDPTSSNADRGKRYFEMMQSLQLKVVRDKMSNERR